MNHLGGHCNYTWVDGGVLRWAKYQFGIQTMVDIGCGPGWMSDYAEQLSIDWTGIDGDSGLPPKDNFILWDFTKGRLPLEEGHVWDLGWSVEFLEHVEERYIPNYMPVFSRCHTLIVTAAPPKWGGYHHVNEQTQEYWIKKFEMYGFRFSEKHSNEMKTHSTMQKHKKGGSFMRNTGMFFIAE